MGKSIDIRRLIDLAFGSGVLSRDGVNYAIHCPSCNDTRQEKKKLIIRLDDTRYHCWVCGLKGSNVKSLIGKFRPDLIEKLGYAKFVKSGPAPVPEVRELSLPEGFEVLGVTPSKDPDITATKKYLRRRGLSNSDIMRWRILGYPFGKFRRRAVIPSYDATGKLNYFVARAIDDTIAMRYKNPKVSKESVIFNEIDIDWRKPIVLVEGAFDAIKCPENTIPILGSSISKTSRLFQEVLKHQPHCVVALDPDLRMKAYKLATLLVGTGCKVDVIFAPEGKDFGDLSQEQATSIIANSKPYTDMMRLSYKIRKLRSGSII